MFATIEFKVTEMESRVAEQVRRLRDGLTRTAIDTTVNWAHRSAFFREWLLDHVASTLDKSYVDTEPNTGLLGMQLWFGRSLRPFVRRLVEERPRAAQVLVRLARVWAQDVRRRTAMFGGGVATPCTVVVEPTNRCNLNCPGCYAKSTRKGEDLPYDVLRQVIREVRDIGVTLVTITGGEPFLREAEDQAVTRLAAEFPNMGFLVYTNSLLINEDVARRLGEVGNVFPAISMEGHRPETDGRRGKGYYESARRVREALAEHEVMHGFSATVTCQNAELVASDEFIERRIEEGDLFGWYFLMQPIGRAPKPSLLTTATQRTYLRDQIYKWRVEGRPIFIGDFWNDGLLVGGCIAAARYYFHIYANGDISPCVFSPVACGNIKDIISGRGEYRSLGDFVNRNPFFRRFREKQREITDWRAPCMLMDNPEKFRQVCARGGWYPGNNMPDTYLRGEIADALDRASHEWTEELRHQPIIPEWAQEQVAEVSKVLAGRGACPGEAPVGHVRRGSGISAPGRCPRCAGGRSRTT